MLTKSRSAFCLTPRDVLVELPSSTAGLKKQALAAGEAERVRVIAKEQGVTWGCGLLLRFRAIALTLRGAFNSIGDQPMQRRLVTYRIRIGCVARHQVGLAPAAAVILNLLRTRAARFLHPRIAAVGVKSRRIIPDPAEIVIAHTREFQTREHACRVTGKRIAVGRNT